MSQEAAEGALVIYVICWFVIGLGAYMRWEWQGLAVALMAFGAMTLAILLFSLWSRRKDAPEPPEHTHEWEVDYHTKEGGQ